MTIFSLVFSITFFYKIKHYTRPQKIDKLYHFRPSTHSYYTNRLFKHVLFTILFIFMDVGINFLKPDLVRNEIFIHGQKEY